MKFKVLASVPREGREDGIRKEWGLGHRLGAGKEDCRALETFHSLEQVEVVSNRDNQKK